MNTQNATTIKITETGGLGDGIARHEGRRIIVPYTLPGDTVSVRILGSSKDTVKAQLIDIIEPSADRVTPPCKHFGTCGGCSMQHFPEATYSQLKERMLTNAVNRAGYDTAAILPMYRVPSGSRRRAVFKVEATATDNAAKIGYYESSSHRLMSLEHCPILEEPIVQIVLALKPLIPSLPYPESVREISVTLSDSGLDLIIIAENPPELADIDLFSNFAQTNDIARVSWQTEQTIVPIIVRRPVQLELGNITVNLPESYFLQATRQGQERITQLVIEATRNASNIADLYAGCGTYSFPMTAYASVNAVEGSALMIDAMEQAIVENRLEKKMTVTQRDIFKKPLLAKQLAAYDAVVINPPRNGAETQIAQLAQSKTPIVVMISCNPNSFERDAKLLRLGGYTLEKVLAIDQFLWSSHLEVAGVFHKDK